MQAPGPGVQRAPATSQTHTRDITMASIFGGRTARIRRLGRRRAAAERRGAATRPRARAVKPSEPGTWPPL